MRAARAFTLLEVMIALAIVTLGMSALLVALNSSADTSLHFRERTEATWVGFNELARTRLALAMPVVGTGDGEEEMAGQKWLWRRDIEATQIPGMLKITVRARPKPAQGAAQKDDAKLYWTATVIGFRGDAANSPLGNQPNWQGTAFGNGSGGGRNAPGAPGSGGPAPGAPPQLPGGPQQ